MHWHKTEDVFFLIPLSFVQYAPQIQDENVNTRNYSVLRKPFFQLTFTHHKVLAVQGLAKWGASPPGSLFHQPGISGTDFLCYHQGKQGFHCCFRDQHLNIAYSFCCPFNTAQSFRKRLKKKGKSCDKLEVLSQSTLQQGTHRLSYEDTSWSKKKTKTKKKQTPQAHLNCDRRLIIH